MLWNVIALTALLLFESPRGPWTAVLKDAVTLNRNGEYREALAKYTALLSSPPVKADAETHAYVLSQMADATIKLGAYVEAETNAREALRLLAGARRTETSTFAIAGGTLAAALRAEGNYGEAKRVAEQALALGKKTLSPLAPHFGILVTTLAQILQEIGDLKGAQALCRQAVDIFEKAGESSRMELGSAYQNLAVIYILRGKPRQAVDAVNLALAAWKQSLPPGHPFVVYALTTKVAAYDKLRDFRQAEEIIPEMLRLAESQFGANHPQRSIALSDAAAVYVAEKKYSLAEPLLREAVAIGKRRFPAGHPLVRTALLNYCYVLEKLDRKQEAAQSRAEAQVLLAFPEKRGLFP
jgi:tetratricopeptide (TPR) repeat protein